MNEAQLPRLDRASQRGLLQLVPPLPKPPAPLRSCHEQAGQTEREVDVFLRRLFGERALLVMARQLFVFEDADADQAYRFNGRESNRIAGFYAGLRQTQVGRPYERRSNDWERTLYSMESEPVAVATFMTANGAPGASSQQKRRMLRNTSSGAGYAPLVGVALDEPVEFLQLRSLRQLKAEQPSSHILTGPDRLQLVPQNSQQSLENESGTVQ